VACSAQRTIAIDTDQPTQPTTSTNAPDPADGWIVVEDAIDPTRVHAAETIFTVGNGVFSTRGSFEEGYAGARAATFMHGVFGPHPVATRTLVNLPDWTHLELQLDGDQFSVAHGEVLAHRRTLDLRSGLLRRDVTWRSPSGATVRLGFERFASLAAPDTAATRMTITSMDDIGPVMLRAGLPRAPVTAGTCSWEPTAQQAEDSTASVAGRVEGEEVTVAVAARLRGPDGGQAQALDLAGGPVLETSWQMKAGETRTIEKAVALLSSRQTADPHRGVRERLSELAGRSFDELHAASVDAWQREWAASDVIIEGDPEAQLAIRFAVFHLLIAAPREDEGVSIGAKTLSGQGYHGHVFWDTETFMLPFFTNVHPAIARNLLSYRYHRLPGARRKAKDGGFEGAQFPWESADTGDEVTPTWGGDASDTSNLVRIWTGDIQIHVSAMVAHAVMAYWDATGDEAFMLERGAEITLDTARFWESRAEWNSERGQYRFSDVIGPDEYHEHVDDNAFTNYFAAWHLRTAADLADWLRADHPDDADRLGADAEAAARFREVASAIHLPRDPDTGLIEQFDGYFEREDVDLERYAGRSASMQAILGVEGVNATQVLKQPDVLMLGYLLPEVMDGDALAANYAYYTPRTDHAYGSSLGPAVQAILATRMGQLDDAYAHFIRAARADLRDARGNTSEGIHAAAAGGLWQAVVFGFAGVELDGDEVRTNPRLPAHWRRLAFRLVRRGRTLEVDLRR